MSTRRNLMLGGMASLGLLAGGGGLARAQAAPVRLRMTWWGTKERADRTMKVSALYSQLHPNVSVDSENMGWSDYWPKLATQVVGRNAPDLIQMDYRYLFEYARRGVLLPLDSHVPGTLQISDWDPKFVDVGKAAGKLYGVNFGANSPSMMFNRTVLEQSALPLPTPDLTWDAYAKLGAEITRKANRADFYGLSDAGQQEPILEIFLRQKGKLLYAPDDKLGFATADMEEWFGYWDRLRKSKACVPAEVQALYQNSLETSPLTLGKAAIDFAHSNQLVAMQKLNRDRVTMTMVPTIAPDAPPGQYLKPSQLLSVYGRSPRAEEAVKLLNFYVTDPRAGEILGVERGVPIANAQREVIKKGMDESSKELVAYIDMVSTRVGPVPPPPPKGAGEIANILKRTNEEIGFGRLSPRDGARRFVNEANDVLERG